MRRGAYIVGSLAIIFAIRMSAAELKLSTADTSGVTFSGWGWQTMGQVVSSESEKRFDVYDCNFEREWLVNYQAGLRAIFFRGQHYNARLHIMASLQYPILRNDVGLGTAEAVQRRFSLALLDATSEWKWGLFDDRDLFQIEFGYLPIKYNSHAMNLGEYLFRSGTYPGYLISGFELADKVKRTGLHVSYSMNKILGGSLRQDLYLTNEEVYPVNDFSLVSF